MAELEKTLTEAMSSKEPIAALRLIALDLSERGYGKEEIYAGFFEFYKSVQAEGKEMEEEILGDVMDMIMGWFPPFNLKLNS